ncbi:MAG TPA: 3-dehydroquinate synthase [Thermoanaerobaculia bacterium]|nr:3-dehydroquinate synthase [Thermoanaerobaculia bacterium]
MTTTGRPVDFGARLRLEHDRGVCPIFAGYGCAAGALRALAPVWAGRTVFLLSTPAVGRLHGAAVRAALEAAAGRVVALEAPDGESAKSVDHAVRLWREMIVAGGKRDSVLVALGGGSVLDLGGFVAACFLRGIDFVHLPTTLLAQVDAAIGGKTGLDLPEAKNSVGAFRQPAAVVADTAWLETLPAREIRAGLQEVVKIAAVLDRGFFERLERELDAVVAGEPAARAAVIERAMALKVEVVEQDPYERDLRRLLNFGHTLGHALEAELGYQELLHGEAVAHGMLYAVRLARARGLDPTVASRIEQLVGRLGPPPLPALDASALLARMARDKKARESGLAWVLPEAVGRGGVHESVAPELVSSELARFLGLA